MTIPDSDMEELNLYLAESREHLETIESDLLAIETAGENINKTLVDGVFRAAHSIKGGAGFFDLKQIRDLAHKIENVLDLIRSKKMVPTPEVINILLLSFDRLRELVFNYSDSNQVDISEFVTALNQLTDSAPPQSQKSSVQEMVAIKSNSGRVAFQVPESDLARVKEREEYVYLVEIDLLHDIEKCGKTPAAALREYSTLGTIMDCEFNIAAAGTLDDDSPDRIPIDILFTSIIDSSFIYSVFEGIPKEQIMLIQGPAHPQALLKETPVTQQEKPAPAPSGSKQSKQAASADRKPMKKSKKKTSPKQPVTAVETLRVNVNLLDDLMNLAGELVLSRNQLHQAINQGNSGFLRKSGQRINIVTSELQEAITLTRMQPIGNILTKYTRIVRDMARELDQEIELEILGKDVELDKTLIEDLNEPLTHMVRNAVDHGIGNQAQRIALGKNPVGKITLRAYHSAGQVVVQISDDGNGIDPQKVALSAVKKGLVTKKQIESMSDKEKVMLIMRPGVSTAEKVTDISGRGVGMDVVKTNIDHLGGKIEIESETGKGTTFKITLPLTLAIIPSLLVDNQEETFAIPQVNVRELIHVVADQVKYRIEVVGDAEVLILRGELVPLVRLSDLLGIERKYLSQDYTDPRFDRRKRISDRRSPHSDYSELTPPAPEVPDQTPAIKSTRRKTDRRFHASSDLRVVIVSTGSFNYGLIVEKMDESVEIVVRPLGRHLKGCQEYSGATVLGDGCVALILDADGLATKSGLTSMADSARALELREAALAELHRNRQTVLLFRNASAEHCGIPLEQVARIEHIQKHQVESLGERRAMQYRGAILPLITLHDTADVHDLDDTAELVVIVLQLADHEIGLLAAMPVDVVETEIVIDTSTHRQPGIAGSCIINDQTTLIVDALELAGNNSPQVDKTNFTTTPEDRTTVLLAEDSAFFRRQVQNYLEQAGYHVLAAEDGLAAWKMLKKHRKDIRLVITDIEMPNMNGLEFTEKIRSDAKYSQLPVIALTSLADEEEIAAGKAAGVDAYEIKLEKSKLLEKARQLLERSLE